MKHITIDRLELDLRGIDPATAEAAVRLLGPELARALAAREVTASPAPRLDAGTLRVSRATEPQALAAGMARQIAHRTSREGST